MNKFLILMIVATTTTSLMVAGISPAVFAQQAPPLEKPEAVAASESTSTSLGKITIQISQTEQIIIDLPLKSENKYQVIPIK
jgi:hypothetical protein